MRQHPAMHVIIVTRQHNLSHNITLIPKVLQRPFCPEVIEAVRLRTCFGIRHPAIPMNHLIAILNKLKRHIPRALKRKVPLRGHYQLH